jgi:hypothetical protein
VNLCLLQKATVRGGRGGKGVIVLELFLKVDKRPCK